VKVNELIILEIILPKGGVTKLRACSSVRNLYNAKELVEEYEAKLRLANYPPY
jgi:hypothetical protein